MYKNSVIKKIIASLFVIAVMFCAPTPSHRLNAQPWGGGVIVIGPIDPVVTVGIIAVAFIWDALSKLGGNYNQTPVISDCDRNPDPTDSSGCNWENVEWTTNKAIISNVPGYEGCNVAVVYQVRTCDSNPLMNQVNIIGVSFDWSWWDDLWGTPTCEILKNHLNSGTTLEKGEKYHNFYKSLYESINKQLFDEANKNSIDKTGHNIICGADGLPNFTSFRVFYTTATCISYVTFDIQAKGNENAPVMNMSVKVDCVDGSCCKHYTRYCYDSNGTLVTTTYDELEGSTEICPTIPDNSKWIPIYNEYKVNYNVTNINGTDCVASCSDYQISD